MLVDEVRGEVKQVFQELVFDRALHGPSLDVGESDATVLSVVCLPHDVQRAVMSHLRQGEREPRVADLVELLDVAELWLDEHLHIIQVEFAVLIRVHLGEQDVWSYSDCDFGGSVRIRGEEMLQASHEFILVDVAIPVGVHQVEQAFQCLIQ